MTSPIQLNKTDFCVTSHKKLKLNSAIEFAFSLFN